MKIRKITFDNNPIFGHLEVDFTNKDGTTVNTIILAGENGVGKSLILNAIYDFVINNQHNYAPTEIRAFELELNNDELKSMTQVEMFSSQPDTMPDRNVLTITTDNANAHLATKYLISYTDEHRGKIAFHRNPFKYNLQNIFRAIFSDIEIHFASNNLTSVTSKTLDNPSSTSERSEGSLATFINQLLIDVDSLDAQNMKQWVRDNPEKVVPQDVQNGLMKRFTDAFDYMFPDKKFTGIKTSNNAQNITFNEHGKETNIMQLSSGEKQIVYRGSFLLKNKATSRDLVVLIDEPEISLHPRWQMKILNYYKHLFTDESGKPTNQIIVSTHSPFIVHNSTRIDDKVLVLKKDAKGTITIARHPTYLGWSNEVAVEEAFDISLLTNSSRTIVFVEGPIDEKYLKKANEIFFNNELDIDIEWVGRDITKGRSEFTGKSALNNVRAFFLSKPNMQSRKVALLYDNDAAKPEENHGQLFIRTMSPAEPGKHFSVGIESLLIFPDTFDYGKFDNTVIKKSVNGKTTVITEPDKEKLCDFVCNEMNGPDQRSACLQ